MAAAGVRLPLIAHVTVETTGTMLLGSEIGAALTALEPLDVDVMGLNCATGPAEMSEHLRYLSRNSRLPVSVMPNAGLPELGPNGAVYPLTPDELATALSQFVTEFGAMLVGGCCGTTPEHITRVVEAVRDLAPTPAPGRARPRGRVLVPVGALPAGRQRADDRRANECQRLEGVPRGDAGEPVRRLRRDRPRPDPRRRRTCSTSVSTMSAAMASAICGRSPDDSLRRRHSRSCSTRPSRLSSRRVWRCSAGGR